MDVDKPALRAVLRARYPWLDEPDLGPRGVEAGECDRCGAEARLVQPCGPPVDRAASTDPDGPADPAGPRGATEAARSAGVGPDWALGRRCASQLGVDAWCGGHEDDARAALDWLARLPPEADEVARLWWVACGEVRLDPAAVDALRARLALDTGR